MLDAQKKFLDETTIAYQKSLELTQNRYASGVASRADVLLGGDSAQVHTGAVNRPRGAACAT